MSQDLSSPVWKSQIDSDRFGFCVAKWNDFSSTSPQDVLEILEADGARLVISRIDAADAPTVRALEKEGFEYMDSQIGYGMKAARAAELDCSDHERAPLAEPSDVEPLRSIAADVFDGFGHYFADPRLDRSACLDIYVDWTERVVRDDRVSDRAFVVRAGSEAAGMFCVKMDEEAGERFVRGLIGFVRPEHQRHGVFKRLLASSVAWAKGEGVGLNHHLVHSTNYPVNAVYTDLGFRITSSWITFHRWLD